MLELSKILAFHLSYFLMWLLKLHMWFTLYFCQTALVCRMLSTNAIIFKPPKPLPPTLNSS